uniref:CCAAT/enhancer binding protein n=1 Tax=Aplysia kurodai TaxID=6501 RepID=Q8WPE1_APLKU|nr:CCAAT/enhancer binding protein [Aplysia kurodai]
MDSLQLSELQTFFSTNKGELTSKKLFVESIDCAPLDLLDPILERALDLSEYIPTNSSLDSHIISTHISPDPTDLQHQSLPQVVLDATALVHEEKYPGEGSVLPPPVVNFLETGQSPEQSDVTSYYSDDSNSATQQMPEFSQLTSPGVDAPSTSGFQWPNLGQVKHEDFGVRTDDFGFTPCQISAKHHHTHTSVPSSIGGDGASLPYVTSPTNSLPSPTSTIYSASSPGTPGPSTPSGRGRRPHGSAAPYSTKSRRRQVEKGTQEYVDKRARNNVAVRKSRAKAKEKQRETEGRVKNLLDQNDQLQKKVDLLSKELNVLKGLFLNVGASIPDEFLKLMGDS